MTVLGSNSGGNSGLRTLPCVMTYRLGEVSSSEGKLHSELYPNPVSGNATLHFTAVADGQYSLSMTDMLGKSVMQSGGAATEGNNMVELNFGSVAKGVYFLSLISN